MSANFGDTNYIYLYDLPKEEVTSTAIAQAFEQQANVQLTDGKPQIRRDLTRPFYSGIVQIKDAQKFNEASEAMKYFQINGKMCRALKFDKSLLGSNKEKLANHNVFIRKVPTDLTHSDLQTKFEKFGPIKSLKVSLNSDHTSRGYGFICFQDEASAARAVQETNAHEDSIAMKFEPKQSRSLQSLINNVYVKNIPLSYSNEQVTAMFSPFGTIKSLVLKKDENVKNYQFGFVCYEDATGKDKEYGPKCAQASIEGLHGQDMGDGMKLYVRTAMKQKDRELEKARDTLRYKTSKKRCNLYVKNFPASWEEDNLRALFEQFGKIEKIKITKPERGTAVYAFVCFQTPDSAAAAKQNLHNHTIEGKALIINHYEIKEYRELQREEAIDKQSFDKYMAQKNGGFHLNDLISHPHMTQILQQLIEVMQHNEAANQGYNQHHNQQRGGYGGGPRHYNNQRGQRNHHQQMGGHPGQHQQNRGGMPQAPNAMQGMPQAPNAMPGQPQMPGAPNAMPGQPQMPGAPMQNQAQLNPSQKYAIAAQKILPSVNPKNPYMKDQVGQAIFEYVCLMVPQDRAPKITGMLIELPVDQIHQYLSSLDALKGKVEEAQNLINQSMQGQ